MRTRGTKLGIGGFVGLLVALAAAAVTAWSGAVTTPAAAQEEAQEAPGPPTFTPTERIDVEEAVSFPYDI